MSLTKQELSLIVTALDHYQFGMGKYTYSRKETRRLMKKVKELSRETP